MNKFTLTFLLLFGGLLAPILSFGQSVCGDFGVSYVDDNTVRVYHVDEGWSASWKYICLDGYCVTVEKADGYYYKDFSASVGTQHSIEFKVQDNTTGQYLSGVETVDFTTVQCSFTSEVNEPTCNDGIQNGDETKVDCGGSCVPCVIGGNGSCDSFGVSYVDDNTIRVYHVDEGWSASWQYICLNGYCVSADKQDGYYYKDFSATIGDEYSTEFKVQDNATGQYLSGVETVAFTTASCSFVGDNEDTTYELAVEGGSGDGAYLEGAVVNVSFETPPVTVGSTVVFNGWTGDTQYVADATVETTSVTMPTSAVSITANFTVVGPSEFTLAVNAGSGDGSYQEGTVVNIAWEIPSVPAGTGIEFSGWTGDTQYVANTTAENTTITIPASAVSITANYNVLHSCNDGILNGDETAVDCGGVCACSPGGDTKITGKFTPKNDKTLMIIGQDLGGVAGYVNSGEFPAPGGITQYTNVYDLAGLTTTTNYGAGDLNLQEALNTYPNAALSIGFYMVEDNDGKGSPDRLGKIDHPNGLSDVANGLYDIELGRLADFFKANAPRPIFLRIGYEFDGQWNHYDPTKYIAAYKHLVDYMNNAGVTNVAYVWQSATYGTTYQGRSIDAWYPGDDYVDHVGLSFFFYDENFNGPNLQFILDFARSHNKPLQMSEVSAQYYELDQSTYHPYDSPGTPTQMTGQGIWEAYFENQFLRFAKENEDVVRSIAYINADWQSQEMWEWPAAGNGFWGDTRIEANEYVAQQWAAELSDPVWLHGTSDVTGQLHGTGVIAQPTAPATPTGLALATNALSVTVSWNAVSNADNYTVSYGTATGSYTNTVANVTGTSTTLSGLSDQTTYYVTVVAQNEIGSSANAIEQSITLDAFALGDIQVTSSKGADSFTLSWNAVNNATGYRVATTVNGNTSTSNITGTSYTASNVTLDVDYTFAVTAYNNNDAVTSTPVTLSIREVIVGDKIDGKFTPANGKTLLAIGQDLDALAGYRNGNMPEPGAAVAYIAFYMLTVDQYGINYGATGMDNAGNPTGIDTDWGSGPLNAYSTAAGWDNSSLILAMSITENWNAGGLQGIANGQYDANIAKLALFCNSFPDKKIYIRIGYEFDGRWNSQDNAGGDFSCGYHKTEEYKAAYRAIVDGLRSRGADNVAFVWQASTSPVDDVLDAYFDYDSDFAAAREDIGSWYPGDDYVDWCGISWFISPNEADEYFGFSEIEGLPNQDDLADEMLDFARVHNKPVMIAESTPQGYDLEIGEYDDTPSMVSRAATGWTYEGANTLFTEGLTAAETQFQPGTWFDNFSAETAWDRWFVPYLNYIKDNQDVIRGITYINANWNEQAKWTEPYAEGYWGDTRIEENPTIKQLWLDEVNNADFWLQGSATVNDQLSGAARITEEVTTTFAPSATALEIYPNPAATELNITNVEANTSFVIFNTAGVEVLRGTGAKVDISRLQKGLFVINVQGLGTTRFIKQ